jgi:hypothetical protein
VNPLAGLSTRIIVMIVCAVLLLGIIAFGVHSCDVRRSKGAQSRVEHSQAEAAANSTADAIGTVARSGEAAAASEDLTRSNAEQIRAAEGAGQKVGSGVDAAGRSALCKRQAYANDPMCLSFRKGIR